MTYPPNLELKATCDSCGKPWTADDVADAKGIVRLNKLGDGRWVIAGFGSGWGEVFVHAACLQKGKRVGSIRGYGDGN